MYFIDFLSSHQRTVESLRAETADQKCKAENGKAEM